MFFALGKGAFRQDRLHEALPKDSHNGHIRLNDFTFLEVFYDADPQVQVLIKVSVLLCQQLELLTIIGENLDVIEITHARMNLQDVVRCLPLRLKHLVVATLDKVFEAGNFEDASRVRLILRIRVCGEP